jgi:hypothetical protein
MKKPRIFILIFRIFYRPNFLIKAREASTVRDTCKPRPASSFTSLLKRYQWYQKESWYWCYTFV